jgi:hydroxymethylpyrimidine/phosphomethylpyrimidine kinase
MTVPVVLTIAGSDSGAGAGIQADLKTFAALGVYGVSALTAVTAQNTLGVQAAFELPGDLIAAQIDAVVGDLGVSAAKTGMLSSTAIIEVVAGKIREHEIRQLVVDPVMVAKGGDRLLREDAVETLRRVLLPLALVLTPNLPEAATLVGFPIRSTADMRRAAEGIAAMGPRYVVVKGGHLSGPPTDILFDGTAFHELEGARVPGTSTHGTGCTFSAAITAGLAQGQPVLDAVRAAKAFVSAAIAAAPAVGHGNGPLEHFHRWREAPAGARDHAV